MKKLFSSMMLHFFAYLKNYLIFIGLLITAIIILYFFKDTTNSTLYCISIYIWACIIFSFLLGVNEYRKLCYNYLNIKINRKVFFISSILFTVLNAILLTAIASVTSAIINSFTGITILETMHYVYLPFVLILFFAIGNCLALIFDNLRGIGILTIIIFAFFTLAFNEFVMDFSFNYLWVAFEYLITNTYVIVTIVVCCALLYLFVYYEIITLNVQRIKK